MLRAFVAQSMLHALVAGLVVEAFLAAWRVDDGAWRLRFRLLALAEPVLVLPLLFLVPGRLDPSFAATWAVFASDRWNALAAGGTAVGPLVLVLTAGLGAALFLRDAAPPLLDHLRGGRDRAGLAAPVPPAIEASVAAHARSLGVRPPIVRFLRLRTPVLLCEDATSPTLVVSTGAVNRLGPGALDAAIAHELAHAVQHDPTLGYLLIATRACAFFNPAVQWIARAAVDDLERRADQAALRLTDRPRDLADAVRTLSLAGAEPALELSGRFGRLFWQAHAEGVERRCERLERTGVPPPLPLAHLRLALAGIGLIALLFFVV
jgi:Zn-dependent protease with chaperone function